MIDSAQCYDLIIAEQGVKILSIIWLIIVILIKKTMMRHSYEYFRSYIRSTSNLHKRERDMYIHKL